MPEGLGRGIARGIELGARNFLDAYYGGQERKFRDKFRKLAPVVQAIDNLIQSPNTPLDQKIKALDSYPALFGIKTDMPLSVQLGLDKLAEQEIETGEQTIQGQRGGLAEDPNAVEFNKKSLKVGTDSGMAGDTLSTDSTMATSVEVKPTKSIKKKILKRRGELSDTDLAIMKQVQVNRQDQEDQFSRQFRLAQMQASIQEKTLAQQGWKNNGDWTYDDATKSWQQEWFNPITKESYQQKLQPGIVPESVILKQIQASGKGNGGLSKAYTTLRESIAISMGKEVGDPEVELATANMWRNNFWSGVVNKIQDIGGTTPIQPNQEFNNKMQILAAQQKHSEFVAQLAAADENVISLGKRKGERWQDSANAFEVFKKIRDEYDPEDKEYQDAQRAYNLARDDAEKLESEYQAALKRKSTLAEQVQLSQTNLNNAGISQTTVTTEYSPQMRAAIAAVRKANPNTKLTDAQIVERIKADPKYSHIK